MTAPTYFGTWQLIPELSSYQTGEPPISATYVIAGVGDRVEFHVSWQDSAGTSHSTSFAGRGDSVAEPLNPGTELSVDMVGTHVLDTTVSVAGVRSAFARRSVSQDGRLMVVMQETTGQNGESTRNFQVYRREAS